MEVEEKASSKSVSTFKSSKKHKKDKKEKVKKEKKEEKSLERASINNNSIDKKMKENIIDNNNESQLQ